MVWPATSCQWLDGEPEHTGSFLAPQHIGSHRMGGGSGEVGRVLRVYIHDQWVIRIMPQQREVDGTRRCCSDGREAAW
jgi:hypothetical protein